MKANFLKNAALALITPIMMTSCKKKNKDFILPNMPIHNIENSKAVYFEFHSNTRIFSPVDDNISYRVQIEEDCKEEISSAMPIYRDFHSNMPINSVDVLMMHRDSANINVVYK